MPNCLEGFIIIRLIKLKKINFILTVVKLLFGKQD